MPSDKYTLSDLIFSWLIENGYTYEPEDYLDFVLVYVDVPYSTNSAPRMRGDFFTISRGTWATSFLNGAGAKRGIMILRDKLQIGLTGSSGIEEIQAWDPQLFDKLKEYLA